MSEEKYVIHINMPTAKGSLIDEIKALPKITAPPKKKKDTPEESVGEPLLLSSVGKKKKKDKDKKKKKSSIETSLISLNDDDGETDIYDSVIESDNLIDIDEILNREDDEDDIGNPIIDEQRRSYEKRKKDENPYKKEFAEELTLLYDLLDEMNKLSKELDKKYKGIEGSKVRGVSKYTNDMVINMLSAKTNKLQIIKEINSLKKTIADLKIKADAKNGKGGEAGEMSADLMATQYFQKVLQFGRGNFVKQFAGEGSHNDVDDSIDDLVSEIESNKRGYSNHEVEDFQQMIEDRLDSEENVFRSDAGSKYIQYENLGVKIYIKRCIDTGEWEFVALDRDNQQIYDYPLPSRRDVGKVRFSDDYATDERGRMYKVIEYFSSPDADEYDEDDDD